MGLLRKMVSAYFRVMLIVRWSPKLSRSYAQWLGVRVGQGVKLFRVSYGSEPWLIEIGDKTWVTSGVSFVTHDGSVTVIRNGPFPEGRQAELNRYGRIVVGRNCFIGIKSIILPGVEIGDNSIIAAGSVVTRNVQAGTIVGGNPARMIGRVEEFASKVAEQSLPIPSKWTSPSEKRKVLSGIFFPPISGGGVL